MNISDRLKTRLEELGKGTPVNTIYSNHLINAVQSFYLMLRECSDSVLVKKATSLVDEAISMHIEGGLKVDCSAGCNYCCNQQVTVTDPEMDMVMRTKLVPIVLSVKLKKQVDAGDEFDSLPHKDRTCVFLTEFGCGIYNDRPIICRLIHSRNKKSCITFGKSDPAIPDYAEAVYTAYLAVAEQRELFKAGPHNMLHKQLYKRLK